MRCVTGLWQFGIPFETARGRSVYSWPLSTSWDPVAAAFAWGHHGVSPAPVDPVGTATQL